MLLIAFKYVSRIYFLNYIVQAVVISVGDYRAAFRLEFFKVVDNAAAEERGPVLKRRLIHDDRCALGLYALHYTLN